LSPLPPSGDRTAKSLLPPLRAPEGWNHRPSTEKRRGSTSLVAVWWMRAFRFTVRSVVRRNVGNSDDKLERARRELLAELRALGIRDERVLSAMERVPRHLFVPPELVPYAYEDRPLPIGAGQTISQPYIVALSTQALELSPQDRVLEIGTGSGYQAAVLAELAGEVYTVERLPELSQAARERLERLGYRNLYFRVGDGTKGWPDEAPFDAILVTAAAPKVPQSLVEQLAEGGRLVIPIGGRESQDLWLMRRRTRRLEKVYLCPCTFVPLIGEEGWR